MRCGVFEGTHSRGIDGGGDYCRRSIQQVMRGLWDNTVKLRSVLDQHLELYSGVGRVNRSSALHTRK